MDYEKEFRDIFLDARSVMDGRQEMIMEASWMLQSAFEGGNDAAARELENVQGADSRTVLSTIRDLLDDYGDDFTQEVLSALQKVYRNFQNMDGYRHPSGR